MCASVCVRVCVCVCVSVCVRLCVCLCEATNPDERGDLMHVAEESDGLWDKNNDEGNDEVRDSKALQDTWDAAKAEVKDNVDEDDANGKEKHCAPADFVQDGAKTRVALEERVECDGHGGAHDPDEPGKHKVGNSEPVPDAVVKEVVPAATVVDKNHDGERHATEGIERLQASLGFLRVCNGVCAGHCCCCRCAALAFSTVVMSRQEVREGT